MAGILYVTMQPSPDLPTPQFHDWYNNEHGPLRLRIAPSIANGFRYRAIDRDIDPPAAKDADEYMAVYDLPDMKVLNQPEYLKLRSDPVQSQRERDIRPDIKINRRNFDLVREWKSDNFTPLDTLAPGNAHEDTITIAVTITLTSPSSATHLQSWYEDEHIGMLSSIPGWLRSRRFVSSAVDAVEGAATEYLALHEYAAKNEYFGPLGKAASSTPRTIEFMKNHVKSRERRIWKRFYTFGPAPRCLAPMAENDAGVKAYENNDAFARAKTFTAGSGGGPAIESYVLTPDGVKLPYRLEGSTEENAPVIVLVNSILVTWGIWDGFVKAFLAENKGYRVLRYNTRGRYSLPASSSSITIDLLAADLVHLLNALRIPSAAAAVGVSLGGATVLAAGLKHPDRIARFLSCDTSASAPTGNAKIWAERISMAENEGAVRSSDTAAIAQLASSLSESLLGPELQSPSEPIVGSQLAEATAARWVPDDSFQGTDEYKRIRSMVEQNSLAGFRAGVKALWEYDYTPFMAGYEGKGRFLVGSRDGKLPESMRGMASGLGDGKGELVTVEGCGHLPMVERPGEVVGAVVELLKQ